MSAIVVKRMNRRTAAMFRADLVRFLGKPKTKDEILWRFFAKEYGRGDDRVTVASTRTIEQQLSAALTSRLVKREGSKRYARYVASSVGAASAARMEAALETRRERNERRWAKGKRP